MTTAGFFHCSVKGVGRATGRSVVAAAAYRSGERLNDEITGTPADYRARGGVIETFILTPDQAPAWSHDRERLWNEAERAEDRANGRMATEFELALPHELTPAQHRELLAEYLRPIIERYGIAADVAIHEPGEGRDHRNIHAHVLITHRTLGADGFGEIANQRTIMKKSKGQEKETRIAGIAATPADIKAIRQGWEKATNRAYEIAGHDIRVDHRSHKDRGIDQEPTKHLGPTAADMERREPGSSERGAANREITQRNADRSVLAALEIKAREIGAEIVDVQAEHSMEEARAAARGRTDDTRAVFASAANRTTDPPTPGFDRDAGEAEWIDKVAEAGIAKDEAARAGPQARPEAEDVRPLGKTANDIRAAWTLTRVAGDLTEALAARGITLAEVSAEEARQSERTAAFAREVGNYAPVLREGEIVAVNEQGDIHRLDQRTTGDLRPEIEARLAGIDRTTLLNVADTKQAMQEAARATAADREEFVTDQVSHRSDAAAERELDAMFDAAGDTLDSGSRATGKFFGGLRKAVESVLSGALSFLVGEPKLTPEEVRAAEERAEARADAAAAEEKEAAIDDQIFMQDRQKAEEKREADLYERFPSLTRNDEGRGNDLDRGRERER